MRFRFLLILIFVLSFVQNVDAQYVVEWAQTFGGDGWDEANTCIETRDGDYVVAGFARLEEQHLWVVKLRNDGEGRWGKTYTDFYTSEANSIIQTYDSCLVIVGFSQRKRAFQSDLLIMKIDTLGTVLWLKNYGEIGNENGLSVIQTRDGGFALCGHTSSTPDGDADWYVMRLDGNGNELWHRQFGSTKDDKALSIYQSYDGGFIVGGYIGGDGASKQLTLNKFDEAGNEEWTKMYQINDVSAATAVIATRDSSAFVVAGFTRVYPILDYDALIMKTDLNGDSLWTRTFGDQHWQEATDLIETYDNAFVYCGFSMLTTKDKSAFIVVKYDTNGNKLWDFTFKRRSQDYAKSIVETRDNGLLISGTTSSYQKGWDMAVLKMQNVEKSDMRFSSPQDSISAILKDSLKIIVCMRSFGIPNSVKILVNDVEQVVMTDFQKPEKKFSNDCDYQISYDVKLTPGKNEIKFVVVDYKNYKFEKSRIVYHLPKFEFMR